MFTKFNQFELSTDKQQAVLGGNSPRFLSNIGGIGSTGSLGSTGSMTSATINQGSAANSADAANQQFAQQRINDKSAIDQLNNLLTSQNQILQGMYNRPQVTRPTI